MTQDEYIVANRNRRVEDVALELSRRPDLDAPFVLRQIEGWQRMRTKVPRWAEVEGIHFPPRLALEQCSGQPAAEYKAKVVERLLAVSGYTSSGAVSVCEPSPQSGGDGGGLRVVDLTGGMGIDFSFIAPLFNTRTYVEQREELVEAARHNFPLLGLADAQIIHGDGVEYLQALPLPKGDEKTLDLIILDPARRDAHGGKTVLIEDCEPNVAEILPLLRAKAHYTMVKLSPMLDLHRAIATLHAIAPGCVDEVHVFSAGGECKDLLLLIRGASAPHCDASQDTASSPTIYCADERSSFAFTFAEENASDCPYASPDALVPGTFIFEPGPSIMKAGAFRTFALHYGLLKLHANSHLYLSPPTTSYLPSHAPTKSHAPLLPCDASQGQPPQAPIPARSFRIERVYSFAKADLKALATDLKAEGAKANLTVRNFPSTVADLRKKLKINEGGTTYLFATTDANEKKIIISCKKI